MKTTTFIIPLSNFNSLTFTLAKKKKKVFETVTIVNMSLCAGNHIGAVQSVCMQPVFCCSMQENHSQQICSYMLQGHPSLICKFNIAGFGNHLKSEKKVPH